MSGSFGGAPISPFPSANALLDIERLNQSQSPQAQQNRLLDLQQKQQQIGAADMEVVSRASAAILGLKPEDRPAAYQAALRDLQPRGYARNAPAEYPGDAALERIAGMGVPAKEQLERRSNIEAGRALLGDTETPPPTPGAAPSVPAVGTTGAAATPGALPPTPQLAPVIAPGGAKFSVAAPHAPRFQALVDDLEASGYKINPDQSGGYNRRYIAGTNTPSNHAHGSAIDINWTANARGGAGDIPPELARRLAAKHGMVWGGDWTGATRDPMHFEVAAQQPAAAPGGGRVQVASATPTVATDGTVAPPGATPVAAPAPAPALAAAPAAGQLNQGQRRQLRALVEAGRPTSEIITLQNQFRDDNAAAANTAYQRQRDAQADARAARAEQRADQVEARAQQKAADEQRAAGKPYQGTAIEAQDDNILLGGDDGSAKYAGAYSRKAAPVDRPDGSRVIPNMAAYDKPTFRGGKGQVAEGAVPDYGSSTVTPPTTLNADQGKVAGYADRVRDSLPTIEDTSPAAMNRWEKLLGKAPILGNDLVSAEFQQHQQAERNFINATLRRESGATIQPDEFETARAQYIPQPGDAPAVLAQKKRNRERVLDNFVREAGPAYKPPTGGAPASAPATGGWTVKRID